MKNAAHHRMASQTARARTCAAVCRIRNTGIWARASTAAAIDPNSSRLRPLRPWVVIAIRSASASRAAARSWSTGSPWRTVVVTRTPLARSSAATPARYASASARSFSTSSKTTAPSTARDGVGTTTRTSVICRSSGPAISRMNGTIDSAIGEPSRGTRARLLLYRTPGQLGAARNFQRRAVGANDEDRDRRTAQHGLRDTAENQAPEAAPAVGGHDDQVGPLRGRGLDDRGGGWAVPHVSLDTPEPPIGQASDDGGQVVLGLADRGHLRLDLVGAR